MTRKTAKKTEEAPVAPVEDEQVEPDPDEGNQSPEEPFECMATDAMFGLLRNGGKPVTISVHAASVCTPPCAIHAPSKHILDDRPLLWREDKGQMERVCEHDVGHPDPDDLAYHLNVLKDIHPEMRGLIDAKVQHGCDGCCLEKKGSAK